jgi:arginase
MAVQVSRRVAVLGAASSIGIRPYDGETEVRHLDRAPDTLRGLGVVEQLAAIDLGNVTPAAYRDLRRPPGGIRNEREVADYSRALAERVAAAVADERFPVVLGGDCSIVLGSLLGASQGGARRVGLAYFDAHADFATPQESMTGSAASMCFALAVGRGDSPLARLAGERPLVRAEDATVIGRRDLGQDHYGDAALRSSGVLDLSDAFATGRSAELAAGAALERIAHAGLAGFWIHIDADVLEPSVMPAVDSPEPGGPNIEQLAAVVRRLVRHPRALGLQITIYDPALDPGLHCGRRLVDLLASSLAEGARS